ncbi:hypothetical protein [Arthrobacter glacialis]|uniref:hypothetical protein n=1 Tax=Arthrobacter glacialis TaxID=1664 RepID=UPI000CD403E3|nr:hypothetical protein [Arthrobacter glacialis]POH60290.1 hypothetical protein CVS28_05005 [Arthrobacter glacialis]
MSYPNRGEARETFINLARMTTPPGISIEPSPLTLTQGDDVYALSITSRTSATDSRQIPITQAAVEKAIGASPDANGAALLFTWIVANNAIGMVALTVEQHDELAKYVNSGFSTTIRDNGQKYYYLQRAVPGSEEMAAFAELETQGKILFYTSLQNSFKA